MGMHRTCGEPDEINKNTHPKNITALFLSRPSLAHPNATAAHVQHSLFNPGSFPSAFAAITLSFGGHACFPSLESGMRTPVGSSARRGQVAVPAPAAVNPCAQVWGRG